MKSEKRITPKLSIWIYLLSPLLLLSLEVVQAQVSPYPFSKAEKKILLQEHCSVFKDSLSKSLTFVSKHPEVFRPLTDVSIKTNNTYWGKITFTSKSKTNTTMVFSLGAADTILVFYPNSQGRYNKLTTGNLIPTSQNDEILPCSNFLKLDIPSEEQFYSFSLYFQASGREMLNLEPTLYEVGHVFEETAKIGVRFKLKYGMYLGLLIFVCLLSFTFFTLTKDNIYFYYGTSILLHIFLFLILSKIAHEYILGEYRELNLILIEIFGFSYWAVFLRFTQKFAETKNYDLAVHNIIKGSIFVTLVTLFASIYFTSTYQHLPFYYTTRNIIMLGVMFVSLFAFIRLSVSKDINIRIINIGGVALALSWVVYFSIIVYNGAKEHYLYQTGQVIQILFFIYAIAFRIRQKDKSKHLSQEKLIKQLRHNEELQEEATGELEVKVRERTRHMQMQNEELKQRNEEIRTQRDEIETQRDEIKTHRNELEEQTQWFLQQNAEISASIQYARRLQEALLHSQEEVNELIPKNFIFYIPRDIVSGDFYWVERIYHYVIVAAADCTGHGVPGAFMSLIGVSALNDIVIHREFTNPGLILDEMRNYVKRTLKQTGKQAEANDGIDIALTVIDLKNRELWYSGAFNPLIIVRKNELIEVKADRMPVGVYYKKEEAFHTHELTLEEGDMLYLYSDGFPDQIGGEKEKKFKSKNFKQLLVELSHLPMEDQKEQLFKTYLAWKGSQEQVDDILIMGIGIE